MAKYEVNCSKCGKSYTIQLFGKVKEREWKINSWNQLCEECKDKEWEETKEKAYQEGLKLQQEVGLPELTGSEKQIKWAESIRAGFWKEYEQAKESYDNFVKTLSEKDIIIDEMFTNKKEEHRCFYVENENLINCIFNHSESKYWIDNRDVFLRDLVKKEKTTKPEITKSKSEIELELQVKEESTIYPKEITTNLKVEIIKKEQSINVIYPEKNDIFYSIIKSYNFTWSSNNKYWFFNIDFKKGEPFILNMLADLSSKLLKQGFPILTLDENLKQKILNNDFTAHSDNWIWKKTEGDHKNWFIVEWKYPANYYNEARRLPGSIYINKKILVPPQSYEEVIDFAKINNFNLSDGAKELIQAMEKLNKEHLNTYIEKETKNKNTQETLNDVLESLKDVE